MILRMNRQKEERMSSESSQEMLKEGFYASLDEDWAEELSLAVEVLDWLWISSHQSDPSKETDLSERFLSGKMCLGRDFSCSQKSQQGERAYPNRRDK
jgi:hypothetical protein